MTRIERIPSNPSESALQHKLGERISGHTPAAPPPPPALRRQTTKHIVQSLSSPFNELADQYFYNVSDQDKQAVHQDIARKARLPEERVQAAAVTAGSIVFVAPDGPPQFFADVYAFLTSGRQDEVRALCVPGVGSSVLGAVGLARDVASAKNIPAAAIVCGYGLRELLIDASGGAFFFRGINELEFALENMRRGLSDAAAGFDLLPYIETFDSLGGGPSILAAKALLRDHRLPHLDYLVGHSKGNLVLSGALAELVCENADLDSLRTVKTVLFSAVCAVPNLGVEPIQIIGSLDALGWANSRLAIQPSRIAWGSMHHLNRKIPCCLDAVQWLRDVC